MTEQPADGGPGWRRFRGWLIAAAALAALFIAALIVNAVDESHRPAPDLQALLVEADAEQVVACGVLASALAAHATGQVVLQGPRAAADRADAALVVVGPGQGPATGLAAGSSVEVSATVRVRAGAGDSAVAQLVDPTSFQVVQSCPGEIVPLSK